MQESSEKKSGGGVNPAGYSRRWRNRYANHKVRRPDLYQEGISIGRMLVRQLRSERVYDFLLRRFLRDGECTFREMPVEVPERGAAHDDTVDPARIDKGPADTPEIDTEHRPSELITHALSRFI